MTLNPTYHVLATVLALNLYAPHDKKYKWFVDCSYFLEELQNLISTLTNMVFGFALAHFYQGNCGLAIEQLRKAIILFPGVFLSLLKKCDRVEKMNEINVKLPRSRRPHVQ